MKKQIILFLLSIVIIQNISADMMTELAGGNSRNPICTIGDSRSVLYAKDGYLHTEYMADDYGVPSIVAYQIHEDVIKLIIRIKTSDLAFRIYDYFYERDGIDRLYVEVHDYYLVEMVYVNDRLETYCNRIRNINTYGFIYNEAEIGSNINRVSDFYYLTTPRLETELTVGMKIRIVALTNERTNALAVNTGPLDTYDYYYILIDDRQVRINGYLLDFSNKVDYRTTLLIFRSGNTPQATPPEEARVTQ